jgi:hypothetical protein
MGIDQYYDLYKILLLDTISMYDVYTTGRKNKYKTEVYVDLIIKVLKTGISWNSVDNNICGDTLPSLRERWKNRLCLFF